jgi:CheY-like chemotaxis protein
MAQLQTRTLENISVLIVDDDEFQLDFVADLLKDLGVTNVATAHGGQIGLDTFDKAKLKPDLLICDIQMPEIDGFEFMHAMRQRDFTGGVILMSGQGAKVLYSASILAQLSRQRFLGTLEKPVTLDAISEKLDQLIN